MDETRKFYKIITGVFFPFILLKYYLWKKRKKRRLSSTINSRKVEEEKNYMSCLESKHISNNHSLVNNGKFNVIMDISFYNGFRALEILYIYFLVEEVFWFYVSTFFFSLSLSLCKMEICDIIHERVHVMVFNNFIASLVSWVIFWIIWWGKKWIDVDGMPRNK